MRRTVAARLRQAFIAAAATFAVVALPPARGSEANPGAELLLDRIDQLVRLGYDHPDKALAALDQLQAQTDAPSPALRREFLLASGIVVAQAGRTATAGASAERLLALSREQQDALAGAGSNLVRAVAAETAGQLDVGAALAQSAATIYELGCPLPNSPFPRASETAPAVPPSRCDHRSYWRALQMLERRALSLGQMAAAREYAQAAFDVAAWAGDAARKAQSLAGMAYVAARSGQPDVAQRSIGQARRMATATNNSYVIARVRANEARIADLRGDFDAGLRITEEAHVIASRSGARRMEAVLLSNLSDSYIRRQRPADALRVADAALPVVREFNDQRMERVLINNRGLAKIGLGRIAEGKQDLARVVDLWKMSGQVANEALTLREYGEALARAGDWRGALGLYHRERALSAEVMKASGELVLREMQTRYDAEAKRRSIELVTRDNALKTAALANRELMQRIWLLLAALMALSLSLAVLLYRRVRRTNRQLEASHAQLRVASERDPLTDLANRRHFHAVMQARDRDAADGFAGTLLLVDIDHFKHINDGHGHAAGDAVIVEVARRLADTVRDVDLVVRWGGEEFLVLASGLSTEQADHLAARLLQAVGCAPVLVEQQAVWVTASIGYACFPLPPYGVPVQWEQAINLADMSLYTAKSQGRNCAVGLVSASAPDLASLRAIENDFERAWHEGRVSLRQTAGPGRQ